MTRSEKIKQAQDRLLAARKQRAYLEICRRMNKGNAEPLARQRLWAQKEVTFYNNLQQQLAA